MADMYCGFGTDGGECASDRAKAIDDSLTWLRPIQQRLACGGLWWRPGLEQKMVDLHARYESVYIEVEG